MFRCALTALAILPASLFAQDLTGHWQGIVHNPATNTDMRTVVIITDSTTNPIRANFYSIEQNARAFPATLTVEKSTVKMKIPGLGTDYEAKLGADGNTMTGTIKGGFPYPVPWNLKRVGDKEAWALPKPPAAPKPMDPNADPVFEVATIKLTPDNIKGRGVFLQGITTDFSAHNQTVVDLVALAFNIHPHQIVNPPAWATTSKYSIVGRPAGEGLPSPDQWRIMVRKLLAERFGLTFHNEQRELPHYTLAVARGGLKITKTQNESVPPSTIYRGAGSLSLNNQSIRDLALLLQGFLDKPVLDQTGLTGRYDFALVWTPDNAPVNPNPDPNAIAPPPDLMAAVQQQLGLKLDAVKKPIEVFVFDKVETPSEN